MATDLVDKLAYYLWFAEYAYEAGTEPNLKEVLTTRGALPFFSLCIHSSKTDSGDIEMSHLCLQCSCFVVNQGTKLSPAHLVLQLCGHLCLHVLSFDFACMLALTP